MSVVLWVVGALLAFLAAVVASPKFRKAAFIWGTYVTLTGWYYYRVLEKRYKAPDADAKPRVGKAKSTSSLASSASASASASASGTKRDADVVYFESPEEIQRRLETASRVSEASSRVSNASSSDLSVLSDDTLGRLPKPPKTHLGIFRRGADDKRRAASEADAMASAPSRLSDATTASASSSRRTFTGRYKKPANWGD